MNTKINFSKGGWILALSVVLVALIISAFASGTWTGSSFGSQVFVACSSAIITALVTLLLLNSQTEKETTKVKETTIYEKKIAAYSKFMSELWTQVDSPEGKISGIRKMFFNEIVFLLSPDSIKNIDSLLSELNLEDEENTKKTCSEITNILREDIKKKGSDNKYADFGHLWDSFKKEEEDHSDSESTSQNNTNPTLDINVQFDKRIHRNCVHFNIWGYTWQTKIFANGINALGLCEYGEVWRTNLVKRCKNNDIVFLYKTGGSGYVGAFLAKGWVVFEADGSGNLEKEVKFEFDKNEKPVVIESEAERAKDVELFCAQSLIDDGSTKVSYLLVEPLVYCENGVGVISVYRRTISAYDTKYAWWTLGRFKAMMEGWPDDLNYYNIDGEKKTYATNAQALQQIFKENNVLSAEWDDNAEDWKDK